MNKQVFIALAMALAPLAAQDAPPPPGGGPRHEGREGRHREPREGQGAARRISPEMMGLLMLGRNMLMERYDADKDGRLSDDERETIKRDMEVRKDQFVARYDTDKDGKLSREEMIAVRDAWKKANPGLEEKIATLARTVMSGPERKREGGPEGRPPGPGGPRAQRPDGPPPGPEGMRRGHEGRPRRHGEPGVLAMLGARGPDGDKVLMATVSLLIEKYDSDGDGVISAEEYERVVSDAAVAMEQRHEEMKKRHEEMLKKYDKDGDGKLSREERRAAMEDMRNNRTKD